MRPRIRVAIVLILLGFIAIELDVYRRALLGEPPEVEVRNSLVSLIRLLAGGSWIHAFLPSVLPSNGVVEVCISHTRLRPLEWCNSGS